jgi:hypothetical protein
VYTNLKERIMKGYKLVDLNESYPYWIDGEKIYFLIHEIKNADLDSFIVYPEDVP